MSCAEGPHLPRGFLVAETARRHPEAAAIVTAPHGESDAPPAVVTYRELDGATADAGSALLGSGLRPGDHVALRLPAEASYPILLMALVRAGLVAVPLSTRLPDAALPALLAQARCRRLIAHPPSPEEPAAPEPGVRRLDPAELLRPPPQVAPAALPGFDFARDATIVFTSGSTGRPKAALHSYASHWFSAAGSNRNIPLGPGDRWLLALPLWHVGGIAILFRAFLAGGAVALPAPGASIEQCLRELGVTHLSLVPTQLHRLLAEPAGPARLSRLKAALLGGSPMPPALVAEAVRRGVPLVTSYGLTEMSSQVTATAPGGPAAELRTSGRPLPYREIAVAPDGEILVRGATLFRGYLDGTRLDPARDAEGWFHTGDLGAIDAEGLLSVAGRKDAMFVSGGENIHPEQIEQELCRHPGIVEAVVVPVEDAEFGARPAAFVRGPGEAAPGGEELAAFLRASLPGFMVPRRYLRLPAEAGGLKRNRRELAELARRAEEAERL